MIRYKFWKELQEYSSTLGTEFVDESQIDAVYDKAKYAVKLVQLYDETLPKDQKLLLNISTIATLNQGVYGMYASTEDKKFLGQQALAKLRLRFGNEAVQKASQDGSLNRLPVIVLKHYAPEIDTSQIKSSDIIHVNVRQHLMKHGDSLNAILEIASTIVHECTHELERQLKGSTSEAGPVVAERVFMGWVGQNWQKILARIPQLGSMMKNS